MSLLDILRDIFGPRPRPVMNPHPSPPPANGIAAELLATHNVERARVGLPALALNPKLVNSALRHASRMAATGIMAHVGIGDGTLATRLAVVGYDWSFAEENIAESQPDVASVMAAWMSDIPHRANILSPSVTEMGGSMVAGFWCVDFGAPA